MSQPIDIIEETDKLSIQLGDIVEINAPAGVIKLEVVNISLT